MEDPRYIYDGPLFNGIDIRPVKYNDHFFDEELEMESILFFELRKSNRIEPCRIIDSTEKEKEEIKNFFNENNDNFFFLFDGEKMIGSILLIKNYLQSLCVKKEYQRKGYGEALVKFAVNHILKNGYQEAVLNILSGNIAAENLYKRIGFRRIN